MALEADEHADKEWPLRPRCDKWKSCRDARFAALAAAAERKRLANHFEQAKLAGVHTDWVAAAIKAIKNTD
jgi:hypothetical protein